MKFYIIDNDYADYLRTYCPNVPRTDYSSEGKCKCFLGVVLEINGCKYFAPLTSWKPQFVNQRNLSGFVPILDAVNNKYLSAIKPYYMFPVPDGKYEEVTLTNLNRIRTFKDDTEKYKYWNFLNKELTLLDEKDVKKQSQNIYNLYLKNGFDINVQGIDYSLAEKKAKEYK